MKKRIAIPVENGILCPHFGHSLQFALVDTEDSKILKEEFVTPPPHEPGVIPAWLTSMGVTDIITGGMGQKAKNIFSRKGINVFAGVPRKSHTDLVKDLLNESLTTGTKYCDHS